MARILFYLLLAANIILYVASANHLSSFNKKAEEPKPEKPPVTVNAPVNPGKVLCFEVGPFSDKDATSFEAESGLTNAELHRDTNVHETRYMVYILPQKSEAAAKARQALLKRKGIEQSFVITDPGQYRFAISLGLFKQLDGAKTLLKTLKSQGVTDLALTTFGKTADDIYFKMNVPESKLPFVEKLLAQRPMVQKKACEAPKEKQNNDVQTTKVAEEPIKK